MDNVNSALWTAINRHGGADSAKRNDDASYTIMCKDGTPVPATAKDVVSMKIPVSEAAPVSSAGANPNGDLANRYAQAPIHRAPENLKEALAPAAPLSNQFVAAKNAVDANRRGVRQTADAYANNVPIKGRDF